MNEAQFIFWAALVIGGLFLVVGVLAKKPGSIGIGAGLVLACIASTMMPEGAMWMHP